MENQSPPQKSKKDVQEEKLNKYLDGVVNDVLKETKQNKFLAKSKNLVIGAFALLLSGSFLSALCAIFVKVFFLVWNLID